MANFFSKKPKENQIAPDSSKPPVQKQNYVRSDTPRSYSYSETVSTSESTINQSSDFDLNNFEKLYLIENNADALPNTKLVNLTKNGIAGGSLYLDIEDAYNAAKKADKKNGFIIHELNLPLDQLSMSENLNNEEVFQFDALTNWSQATRFSPTDTLQNGKKVSANQITFTCYVMIPGSTKEVFESSTKGLMSDFPPIFASPQQAFDEVRKKYPHHALTLVELKMPLVDRSKINEKVNDLLGYLKEKASEIKSISQFSKNLNEAQLFDKITPENNSSPKPRR